MRRHDARNRADDRELRRENKGTGETPHGRRIREKGTMMITMTVILGVEKKEQAEADAEKLGDGILVQLLFPIRYALSRCSLTRDSGLPPTVYARYRYFACAEWVRPRLSPRGRTSRTPAGSRQRRLRSGSLPLLAGLRPMRTPLRAWDRSGWLFRQTRTGHLKSLRLNRASLLA